MKRREIKHQKRQNRSWRCRSCSQRGIRCNLTPAARKLGLERSQQTRRSRWQSSLELLSKSDIARKFYRMGWKAGARSVRRRIGEEIAA